jgi:hypothetical protein
MTRAAFDRVKVTCTTTGTGTLTLSTAVGGFQTFPAALDGMTVSYAIEHQSSPEYEAGYGVYTNTGTTLTRAYVTYPTQGGSAVNLSAGTKHVRLVALAGDVAINQATVDPTVNDDLAHNFRVGNLWLNTSTQKIFICRLHTSGAAVWTAIPITGPLTPRTVSGTTDSPTSNTKTTYTSVSAVAVTLGSGIADGDEFMLHFGAGAGSIIPGGGFTLQGLSNTIPVQVGALVSGFRAGTDFVTRGETNERILLSAYDEPQIAVTISSGAVTLDFGVAYNANGNHFLTALNAAITSITVSNGTPASGRVRPFSWRLTADTVDRAVTVPGGWLRVGGWVNPFTVTANGPGAFLAGTINSAGTVAVSLAN